MGPIPCPPPPRDAVVFTATVVSVEEARYECQTTTDTSMEDATHCVSVPDTLGLCNGHDVILHGADGTERTGVVGSDIGVSWCGLAPGHQVVSLCTRSGPLECGLDLGDTDSLTVGLHGSLPHPYRYQLHADQPIERLGTSDIAVDADKINALKPGDRLQFTIVPTDTGAPPVLEGCGLANVPESKPPSTPAVAGHGCAGCAGAGDPRSLLLVVAASFLLAWRRHHR